jgi:hypothetical protein
MAGPVGIEGKARRHRRISGDEPQPAGFMRCLLLSSKANGFPICPNVRDAVEVIEINIVGAYVIEARRSGISKTVKIIL